MKSCRERWQAWAEKNPEKFKASKKKWREKNKKHLKEYKRKLYKNSPKVRETSKRLNLLWRTNNREKMRAYNQKHYHEKKEAFTNMSPEEQYAEMMKLVKDILKKRNH